MDFAPRAIRIAQHKASSAGLKIFSHAAKVTDLGLLTGTFG